MIIPVVLLLQLAINVPCWSFQYQNYPPNVRTNNNNINIVYHRPLSLLPIRGTTNTRLLSEVSNDESVITAVTDDNTDAPVKNDTNNEDNGNDKSQKSFWKPKGKKTKWQERIHIDDLKVGQELHGHVVTDHLEGKTGPKLFFDCGVGRTSDNKKNDTTTTTIQWFMVNGMLRLPRSNKVSVSRKRATKYRSRDSVSLYVARIQKECGRLEVVLTPEEVELYQKAPPKVSVASLQPNQVVEGTIVKVHPYGATVDVGANRKGLLHIRKVAALYDRYIDKERGLVEAGIEEGARVRLMVESIEKRRLFLDFTPDVKEEAAKEKKQEEQEVESPSPALDKEELDDWSAFAASQQTNVESQQRATAVDQEVQDYDVDEDDEKDDDEEGEEEGDYDGYDEESDIEEALGLDTY